MNIKEHIEAGHYPKDEKGRALVTMRCGTTATIVATDGPEGGAIVGWYLMRRGHVSLWAESGRWQEGSGRLLDLLPPTPRKVKVTRWILTAPSGDDDIGHTYTSREAAESAAYKYTSFPIVVELTGEYEEELPQ
jgi:hypothetical protein